MFAKFDQIPAITLQDIKETKRYGDGRTEGQRENSICGVSGGIKITWPCVYKAVFMLNLAERELSTAYKTKMLKQIFSCFLALRCCINYSNKC